MTTSPRKGRTTSKSPRYRAYKTRLDYDEFLRQKLAASNGTQWEKEVEALRRKQQRREERRSSKTRKSTATTAVLGGKMTATMTGNTIVKTTVNTTATVTTQEAQLQRAALIQEHTDDGDRVDEAVQSTHTRGTTVSIAPERAPVHPDRPLKLIQRPPPKARDRPHSVAGDEKVSLPDHA